MTDTIDTTTTLAALVGEQPALARVFESLRLDYCCGGGQSLADACAERGLDPTTVSAMLAAFAATQGGGGESEERDWRQADLAEFCDHIVSVHHDGLRRELPRLGELFETVVRVHGFERPQLAEAEATFTALRSELEGHIEEEEGSLFPAIRELGEGGCSLDEAEVSRHEDEHAAVGEGLARLRGLADDYDRSRALCSTHRALLEGLAEFEADLHRHVHKENNLLFPRARELAGRSGAEAGR